MEKIFSNQSQVSEIVAKLTLERQEFFDSSVQGLMLVKRKNGVPQWSLRYICSRLGKNQTYKLGLVSEYDLNSARSIALNFLEKEYPKNALDLQNIQNALDPDRSQKILLKEFVTEFYLPYILSSKRSYQTDVSILNNHILPSIGSKELRSVSPYDVQKMIQDISSKGLANATSNRALIITRFMFNCVMKWQTMTLSQNPCIHMKEKIENNKKERFLKPHEITNLKVELRKSHNKFLPYIVQLMILTGCRRGEALNAKVIHFDFGRGDWVVPLPKGGKARHIPLSDLAIQTVKATINYRSSLSDKMRNSEYLFPSPITGEPFKQIHYSWDKARTAANLADVRMHDLRHSFASALVNEGMTLYDVKQILGHTNIKTTERYAHLSNQRLQNAASTVIQHYGKQNWLTID